MYLDKNKPKENYDDDDDPNWKKKTWEVSKIVYKENLTLRLMDEKLKMKLTEEVGWWWKDDDDAQEEIATRSSSWEQKKKVGALCTFYVFIFFNLREQIRLITSRTRKKVKLYILDFNLEIVKNVDEEGRRGDVHSIFNSHLFSSRYGATATLI